MFRWEVEVLRGYQWPRYLIINRTSGGYLADNNGGALHFLDREIAEEICNTLNTADIK